MSHSFPAPQLNNNLAYNMPPHRFIDREYFIITYETDIHAINAILPPGLKVSDPIVKFEFMKMPDASGFGCFSEAGQIIPVTCEGLPGTYTHSMFLNCHAPVAGGREIWGFPKVMADPCLEVDRDHILGTLNYGKSRVATGTMSYKQFPTCTESVEDLLTQPGYLLKSIPGVDGGMALCQLVRYSMTDVNVKWAYHGEASLEIHPHVMARLHHLPVKKVLSAAHFIADLTLPFGEVVIDYLQK